jgi:hypothetical protein
MLPVYVYPVGSRVIIDESRDAVVVAVTICAAHDGALAVRYACEWWDGGDMRNYTFDSFRVKADDSVRSAMVGFNPGSSD